MRINVGIGLAALAIVGFGDLAGAQGGAAARHLLAPTARAASAQVGGSVVTINVADTGTEVTFIRVHQNEMPGGAVGARINAEVPSRFIDLSHRGSRNVALTLGGHHYWFDPNRIYSVDVAPGTLGVGISRAAQQATDTLAADITSLFLPDAPVIALHNNRGTLLKSYASGAFKTFTHGVYVNPLMDSSTFAVVSTNELFDAIRRLGISVVWDGRARMTPGRCWRTYSATTFPTSTSKPHKVGPRRHSSPWFDGSCRFSERCSEPQKRTRSSPTSDRLIRSPNTCCWIVSFVRSTPFTAVVRVPSSHATPK